jgi:hypothetical protein
MSKDCENTITVTHDDPKVIERIIKAYKCGELFSEFLPVPKELPGEDRDDWCHQHWTGWRLDEEGDEYDDISLKVISPNKIRLFMCTWHWPPISLLNHWVDLGCTVYCAFFEPCHWDFGVYKDKMLWHLGETDADIEASIRELFGPFEEAEARESEELLTA